MKQYVMAAFAVLILATPVTLVAPVYAQGVDETGFEHRYARPGRATMTVYLWGEVGTSGIWQVEENVDLIALLSAADVPGVGTNDPEYRQRVVLTVFRGPPNQRRQVYREDLEQLVAESATYPELQNEDVLQVQVERERRLSFQTILSYVSSTASLILLALRLTERV